MKKKLKSNKGITLTVLVITIIILLMISTAIIHTVADNLSSKGVNDMYTDIKAIEDKVSVYYVKYGNIPKAEQVEVSIPSAIVTSNQNNGANFYYVDLSKLDGLSLKYGKGTGNSTDRYIINEQSHTVYYLEGVETEGTMYYTINRAYMNID